MPAGLPPDEARATSAPKRKRRKWLFIGAALLIFCAGACLARRSRRGASDSTAHLNIAFTGDSSGLSQTVIVPTLDTPSPSDKNVLWCSSFQTAWNHLKNDVIKAPVQMQNAEAAARRLNQAGQSEADLPPRAYYATAGLVREGIIPTIQQEMAKRFPGVPKTTFESSDPLIAVAYAYLAANVKFTLPFLENRKPLLFLDSAGAKTPIASFGLREEDMDAFDDLRGQVKVLHHSESLDDPGTLSEFVIDPCANSTPNQLILARIPPKATLAGTLADLRKKLEAHKNDADFVRPLGDSDVLLVPDILFDVTHRFKELEGPERPLLNPGFGPLWLQPALQEIRFKLDRSGAELVSEAKISAVGGGSTRFVFDRPFLIVVKKRGATEPFFVMWVDNAELLCRP